MAMSLPGTGSGLPAGPAAPGELAVPISSSPALSSAGITMATRRPGPARHQRGRDQRDASAPAVARRSAVPGTPSGSAAAGAGHVRPGIRSGLSAGPAAAGALAVPISSSAGIAMATTSAGTGQAPKGKGSAGHRRAGSGPAFCSTWYATGISTCSGTDQQFGGTGRSRSDMFRRVAKTQR